MIKTIEVSIHAPRWGATKGNIAKIYIAKGFNPAPRVGSDPYQLYKAISFTVSIHAPRVGSDERSESEVRLIPRFNPRPPSGERRDSTLNDASYKWFQSTPPEWGATWGHQSAPGHWRSFNPRPPSGERPSLMFQGMRPFGFNPRPPSGERPYIFYHRNLTVVSFHAPEWGRQLVPFSLSYL
jgi:hypothetical protein